MIWLVAVFGFPLQTSGARYVLRGASFMALRHVVWQGEGEVTRTVARSPEMCDRSCIE